MKSKKTRDLWRTKGPPPFDPGSGARVASLRCPTLPAGWGYHAQGPNPGTRKVGIAARRTEGENSQPEARTGQPGLGFGPAGSKGVESLRQRCIFTATSQRAAEQTPGLPPARSLFASLRCWPVSGFRAVALLRLGRPRRPRLDLRTSSGLGVNPPRYEVGRIRLSPAPFAAPKARGRVGCRTRGSCRTGRFANRTQRTCG